MRFISVCGVFKFISQVICGVFLAQSVLAGTAESESFRYGFKCNPILKIEDVLQVTGKEKIDEFREGGDEYYFNYPTRVKIGKLRYQNSSDAMILKVRLVATQPLEGETSGGFYYIKNRVTRAFVVYSSEVDDNWRNLKLENKVGDEWEAVIPKENFINGNYELTLFLVAIDRFNSITTEMPLSYAGTGRSFKVDSSILPELEEYSSNVENEWIDDAWGTEDQELKYGIYSKDQNSISLFAKPLYSPGEKDEIGMNLINADIMPDYVDDAGYKVSINSYEVCSSAKVPVKKRFNTEWMIFYWSGDYYCWRDSINKNVSSAINCDGEKVVFKVSRKDFLPPFLRREMDVSFFSETGTTKFMRIIFKYHTCKISGGKISACFKRYDS